MYTEQSTTTWESPPARRISWGAIFAGISVAIMIQVLLTLLGIGIGAATVNPLQEPNLGEGVALRSLIWFAVTAVFAMYVGGRVAGGKSDCVAKKDRMHHGIFAWAAATILSAAFLASAVTSLLGSAAGSAAAGTVTQANATPATQQNATQVNSAGTVTVNEPQLRQAGEVAAERLSQTALATFGMLLLTGAAAALGGWTSAARLREDERYDVETERHVAPAYAK